MKLLGLIVLWVLVCWVAFASVIYAIRHPEQTDTQRLLNFKEMMFFK